MRNYKVLKQGSRYTIGEYDKGYNAYIINDGICNYYYWDTKEKAQAAADAYNEYEGEEWLGQHGYDNDVISRYDIETGVIRDEDMIELYRLFGAVKNETLYASCILKKSDGGFGYYERAGDIGEPWVDSSDLARDMNLYTLDEALQDQEFIDAGIEDIRGRVRDEPTEIFAQINEDGNSVSYFGIIAY